MLHVVYGPNIQQVRDTALSHIQTYQSQGYELHRIDAHSYEPGMIADLCEGVSLFGTSNVNLIDTPRDHAEFWAEVLACQTTMADSLSPFILIEGAIPATEKKRLTAVNNWEEVAGTKKEDRFDSFRLANAFVDRDKRALWITMHEAKAAGIAVEEMIGILWWQIKLIRLTQITNSAREAGVKDFPYRKAKQAGLRYSQEQVLELMRSLLAVYHDGHGGIRDIELALEEWVLRI